VSENSWQTDWQNVFTVLRILRSIFGRRRPWLGELCRIAACAVVANDEL